jgi:hypothetical protein
MNYPTIPPELSVRSVPLTNQVGQSCACPWNIPGVTAVLDGGIVFIGNHTYIAHYSSPQEAWEDALFTACRMVGYEINEVSFASDRVQNQARKLIGTMEWWAR